MYSFLIKIRIVPYAVVNVEQGKRYRLRIFSLACRPFFTFSIDGHNMTFIEADGIEHDPAEFQNVDIYPGAYMIFSVDRE
jgi:iron transport multicopper oxidase